MKTSQWRRAVQNMCIFSAHLKALSHRSGDRSADGRRFHMAGPLTTKLRCPVAVQVRGKGRVPVAADCRCWRPEMAVAGTQQSLNWHYFKKPVSWSLAFLVEQISVQHYVSTHLSLWQENSSANRFTTLQLQLCTMQFWSISVTQGQMKTNLFFVEAY